VAYDWRSGSQQVIGCWLSAYKVLAYDDQRTAYRVDVDWYLARHSLRAGADLESNQTNWGSSALAGPCMSTT